MITISGQRPFIREWIEERLGEDMVNETLQLGKKQRLVVKRMMSPNKYTRIIKGLPVRFLKLEELEPIAKELFGDGCYAPVLFFHPKREPVICNCILNNIHK